MNTRCGLLVLMATLSLPFARPICRDRRGKLNKLTKAERESQRAGADVLSWVHSGGLASELSSLPFASSLRFPFEDLFVNDALDQCDQ